MSAEDSEKKPDNPKHPTVEDLEKNKEAYQDFERKWQELSRNQENKLTFIRGIALGLFYGIIGNLFVQFWYSVFESLILRQFNEIFWVNLILSVSLGIVIIIQTWQLWRMFKDAEHKLQIAKEAGDAARFTLKEMELSERKKKLEDVETKIQ